MDKHSDRLAGKTNGASNLSKRIEDPGNALESTWNKCEEDSRSSFLDSVNVYLFDALRAKLEQSTIPKHQAKDEVLNFLRNEKNTRNLDDCVRWSLLSTAVEKGGEEKDESKKQAPIELMNLILDISPRLAFINRWMRPFKEAKALACHNGHAKKPSKLPLTPFHLAAAVGNVVAIKSMYDHGKRLCQDEEANNAWALPTGPDVLLKIMRMKDTNRKKTALELARSAYDMPDDDDDDDVVRAARYYNVVETLLELDPRIGMEGDLTEEGSFFIHALNNGHLEIVKIFLKYPELQTHFATRENILRVIEDIQKMKHPRDRKPDIENILCELIENAKGSNTVDQAVIQEIIKADLYDIWERTQTQFSKFESQGLLHVAVYCQSLKFVNKFLMLDPKSVTTKVAVGSDDTKHYPLWYNNEQKEGFGSLPVRKQIREAIVTATIREVSRMQTLSDIFRLSNVTELCFDLSLFHPTSDRLTEFVKSLVNHRESAHLISYEPTIKYVAFPPLDERVDDRETFGMPVVADHKEVFDILYWLRQSKGVRKVFELKVPDRLVNPHDESKIAMYVERLGVEVLDWRFLDLSLSVFSDKAKSKIQELHLYASGKRAPIDHWFSSQGLGSFPKELMTGRHCQKFLKYVRNESRSFEASMSGGEYKGRITAIMQPWTLKHDKVADLDEIAAKVVPRLSRFIPSYRGLFAEKQKEWLENKRLQRECRRTRVAIIDNGILSISPKGQDTQDILEQSKSTRQSSLSNLKRMDASGSNKNVDYIDLVDSDIDPDTHSLPDQDLIDTRPDSQKVHRIKEPRSLWPRIHDGRSFVGDDFRVSPWMFASDPHGTQMANLICAIDPECELYVAKVTDGRHGISAESVVKAIDWAIEKEVDIISMSFAILDADNQLTTACDKANTADIVMLCSTHDEGLNVGKAWPASHPNTITITACDEYGHVPPRGGQDHAYALRGLNVAAGAVPFLESSELISGSSVATAIAAGLSSLILSCDRIARDGKPNPSDKDVNNSRRHLVETYMETMKAHKDSNYVLPEKFGSIDSKLKAGKKIDARTVLQEHFKSANRGQTVPSF
ncbi:hypothetical protein N7451_004133 [Penicillium sp. IBT 35674x]|nr:hypothetical protein N7451_004133 [Penicillium sp. IBT 35674x]